MKWQQLVPLIKGELSVLPAPHILILHAGGNDLAKVKTLQLLSNIWRDMSFLKWLLPHTVIVFSEIVPRLLWQPDCFLFFEKIRKRLNKSIEKFMPFVNGFSFRHVDLEGFSPGLFRPDTIHLSEIGLDIFNAGLQVMVEKGVELCGRP